MSSAARTNLTSQNANLNLNNEVGVGAFRIAYGATYVGGGRNQQEAVGKCFKAQYKGMEDEFFRADFRIADRAIQLAEEWNQFCENGKEILITKGDVMISGGTKYLVEPLIRNFCKYTSNNGWISDEQRKWETQALEAFTHYTYHKSGGSLIVCDLQGRYRYDRYNRSRCRFELTDPAICSRKRVYGPTDLGEKGIESFFHNHVCNKFCNENGYWARPRSTKQWFCSNSSTSMLRETATDLLNTQNRAKFTVNLEPIYDYDYDSDDVSDDEDIPMRRY